MPKATMTVPVKMELEISLEFDSQRELENKARGKAIEKALNSYDKILDGVEQSLYSLDPHDIEIIDVKEDTSTE